jgi:hypothetical protein
MRITARELRQIIRETLMQEVPIFFGPDDSATDYRTPPLDPVDRQAGAKKRGSIGRRTLRKASGRAEAKVLFQNTSDNWAIVTLDNVSWGSDVIEGDPFKQWVQRQGFPPGTRILVVGDAPIPRDFTSTRWAVAHDIIGHTLHNWVAKKDIFRNPFSDAKTAQHLVFTAVLDQVSSEKRIGDNIDYIPDALAALFFGEADLGVAVSAATQAAWKQRFPEDLVAAVEAVGRAVELGIPGWINSIPPDKPTLVHPF